MDLFRRIARSNHRARGYGAGGAHADEMMELLMTDDNGSAGGQKAVDAAPAEHRIPPKDTRAWWEKLLYSIDPWFSGLFQGRRR